MSDQTIPKTLSLSSSAFNSNITTTGAKLGQSFFTYDIGIPVSIPPQQSAMIPFLSSKIAARRVSIYNHIVLPDHPLYGARMVNTSKLHLMRGPLIFFDQLANVGTSYVGDAVIEDTEPGQTRLFSFAVDLGVDIYTKDENGGIEGTLSITSGVLYETQKSTYVKRYSLKNNTTESRLVVIEHPHTDDSVKLIEPVKPDEKTSDSYRFNVNLASNESKEFDVKEEQTYNTSVRLIDYDENTLYSYSTTGDFSDNMKAIFHELWAKKRAIRNVQNQITEVQRKIDAIFEGQSRIRQNMNSLDRASTLYKRYVAELDKQETDLENLTNQKMP